MNKTVKGIVQVLFSSVRQIVNEREVRYVLVLYKYEYIHSEYHMNTGKGKCEHHHVRLAVQINWYPAPGGNILPFMSRSLASRLKKNTGRAHQNYSSTHSTTPMIP